MTALFIGIVKTNILLTSMVSKLHEPQLINSKNPSNIPSLFLYRVECKSWPSVKISHAFLVVFLKGGFPTIHYLNHNLYMVPRNTNIRASQKAFCFTSKMPRHIKAIRRLRYHIIIDDRVSVRGMEGKVPLRGSES